MKTSFGVLFVLCLLKAAPAGASSAAAAPRLKIVQLAGQLQIETPDQPELANERGVLPIPSGSELTVLSGVAWFESDDHAFIRAKAGDSFLFTSVPASTSAASMLHIRATADEASSIEVVIGGDVFHLGKDGALAITSTGQPEAGVTAEGGEVTRVSASAIVAGQTPVLSTAELTGVGMPPGEMVVVPVLVERRFQTARLDPSSLTLVRRNATTSVARASQTGDVFAEEILGRANKVIADWPKASRLTAEVMIQKYGPPTAIGERVLVWKRNAPWKKTIVHRAPAADPAPARAGVLEQVIAYDVPPAKMAALAVLGAGVKVDKNKKELSATNDAEEINFLALNLAEEIITGLLTPDQARSIYDKTIALTETGKSSPLTRGLKFVPLAPETIAP